MEMENLHAIHRSTHYFHVSPANPKVNINIFMVEVIKRPSNETSTMSCVSYNHVHDINVSTIFYVSVIFVSKKSFKSHFCGWYCWNFISKCGMECTSFDLCYFRFHSFHTKSTLISSCQKLGKYVSSIAMKTNDHPTRDIKKFVFCHYDLKPINGIPMLTHIFLIASSFDVANPVFSNNSDKENNWLQFCTLFIFHSAVFVHWMSEKVQM